MFDVFYYQKDCKKIIRFSFFFEEKLFCTPTLNKISLLWLAQTFKLIVDISFTYKNNFCKKKNLKNLQPCRTILKPYGVFLILR